MRYDEMFDIENGLGAGVWRKFIGVRTEVIEGISIVPA
jgi:hypothetical protein